VDMFSPNLTLQTNHHAKRQPTVFDLKSWTDLFIVSIVDILCLKQFIMGDTAKPVVIDEHTKKMAVKALMRERDVARVESDFGKSDTLRDKLMTEYGVTIFDQNGGPSGWKFQDGSTKKLPAGIIEAKLPGAVKLEKRKREEGSDEKASKTAKVVKKDKEVVKPKAKAALKPAVVQENNRNSALVNSILGAGSSDTVKTVQGVKIEEKKIGSGKVAVSGKRIKVTS